MLKFRAGKRLLAKVPLIRPVVRAATGNETSELKTFTGHNFAKNKSSSGGKPRLTPVGLAFLLGGFAFASYILKPNTTLPTPALDTFKPQIAIIFGFGTSDEIFQATAEKLGFAYIDLNNHGLERLDQLVKKGVRKFFIEGFKSKDELVKLAKSTVQPDVILNFQHGSSNKESRELYIKTPTVENITDILEKRNLI